MDAGAQLAALPLADGHRVDAEQLGELALAQGEPGAQILQVEGHEAGAYWTKPKLAPGILRRVTAPRPSTSVRQIARAWIAALFARTTRTPDGAGTIVERTLRGRPISRVRHEGGVPHGPALAWWPSGAKRSHGAHVAGRRDGDWFEFQPDGSLDRARTGLYREGSRIAGVRGFNEWLGSP